MTALLVRGCASQFLESLGTVSRGCVLKMAL